MTPKQTFELTKKELIIKHCELNVRNGFNIHNHLFNKQILKVEEMLKDLNADSDLFIYTLKK